MTTFEQYQQDFVKIVTGSTTAGDDPLAGLRPLLDALPYYGDPDLLSAHRGTLCTLLRVNVANNSIAPQPDEVNFAYFTNYEYKGPYSGYADAFRRGAAATAASDAVAAAAKGQNAALRPGWWQDYAVAVLTDAAREAAELQLDTGRLRGDLDKMHTAFLPALTVSYLAVMQAYQPTADALRALTAAGTPAVAKALAALLDAIGADSFSVNINASMALGGDSTQAAVWFLYNLWITLTALGCLDVDAEIRSRQAAGLSVPIQIGPQSWWRGGYSTWYTPLAGADLAPDTRGLLTAAMPEMKHTTYDEASEDTPVAPANGYSMSLCYWGPLARYKT